MRKFGSLLFIGILIFGGYYFYKNYYINRVPKLTVEEAVVDIDGLTIYGTHLNLHGSLINDSNLDLVLYNGDFISYKIYSLNNGFNLAEEINRGIDLEKIPIGKYYAFLRSSNKDEDDNDVYKYYALNNTTEYEETVYYTFSNVGNKIVINSNSDYNTLTFNVSKNTDENIYDVVIDPGHGGRDSGAYKNGYKESDLTLKIAYSLKDRFEKNGIKVKLTREEGQLSSDELLNDYGINGRAVINHEVHAKYVFSIHLNSSAAYVKGLEIYAPVNINYDFAKSMAKNIVNDANTQYSTNRTNKKYDGVYTRTFTEQDILDSKEELAQKNYQMYNITTKSNYYFMIRETGGIMTGAYVDDRNKPKVPGNPYYNSNIGSEAYLIEFAYLTNYSDLDNITNNMNKYTEAITKSFMPIFDSDNS